jgi:hypothetical protein
MCRTFLKMCLNYVSTTYMNALTSSLKRNPLLIEVAFNLLLFIFDVYLVIQQMRKNNMILV